MCILLCADDLRMVRQFISDQQKFINHVSITYVVSLSLSLSLSVPLSLLLLLFFADTVFCMCIIVRECMFTLGKGKPLRFVFG